MVVHDLSTNVDMPGVPLPRSEAQTRPLLCVKDIATRATVWKDVLNRFGECPTQSDVQCAVDNHLAIQDHDAQHERPHDGVMRQHCNGKTALRAPAPPMPTLIPSPTDGAVHRWELQTVQTMVDDVYWSRHTWLTELAESERPKVNDLLGDLRLLADVLETALATLENGEHACVGEEGGDGGIEKRD